MAYRAYGITHLTPCAIGTWASCYQYVARQRCRFAAFSLSIVHLQRAHCLRKLSHPDAHCTFSSYNHCYARLLALMITPAQSDPTRFPIPSPLQFSLSPDLSDRPSYPLCLPLSESLAFTLAPLVAFYGTPSPQASCQLEMGKASCGLGVFFSSVLRGPPPRALPPRAPPGPGWDRLGTSIQAFRRAECNPGAWVRCSV